MLDYDTIFLQIEVVCDRMGQNVRICPRSRVWSPYSLQDFFSKVTYKPVINTKLPNQFGSYTFCSYQKPSLTTQHMKRSVFVACWIWVQEKLMIKGKIEGKRSSGKTPMHWIDQNRIIIGSPPLETFIRSVENRELWKQIVVNINWRVIKFPFLENRLKKRFDNVKSW